MARSFLAVFRQPRVIVGEIATIGILAALGAMIPQAGSASEAELAWHRTLGPIMGRLIGVFSLDHVFQSVWFAVATALAAISLSLSLVDQFRRLRVAWLRPLNEKNFDGAPFRREFERPARTDGASASGGREVCLRTEHRVGLLGSPVFHTGILLIALAGTLQALFGVHAVVDLVEGESLPPSAEAWGRQWPGVLAGPFHLRASVTLDSVTPLYYEKGDLRDLSVRVSLDDPGREVRSEVLAVNHDLHASGGRLFLGSDFGPAPLIEWCRGGHPPVRTAPLLSEKRARVFEGTSAPSDDVRAYLRARTARTGERPDRLEVRVMKGHSLLFADTVRVGTAVMLAGGLEFRLLGMPFWARLHGSYDPALWLAYLGFGLVLVGATLMFTVIKVDTCRVVHTADGKERVLVALKAQRFAPLFAERFRTMVRAEGGHA